MLCVRKTVLQKQKTTFPKAERDVFKLFVLSDQRPKKRKYEISDDIKYRKAAQNQRCFCAINYVNN